MAQQSSRNQKAHQKKNMVESKPKPQKSFNKTTPSEVVVSESKPPQNFNKPRGTTAPSEGVASKSKPPRSCKKPSGKSAPSEVVSNSTPPGCINKPSDKTTPEVEAVENHFKVGDTLGEGALEAFKEGQRLSDGLKVALKYLPKSSVVKFFKVTGYQDHIPLEIALMLKMQKTCIYPQIIKLLEWYDEPEQYVLVMEWPADSEALGTFLKRHRCCCIDEKIARIIMRQVIQAALACCKRGVLHRNITIENLLVNTKTLEVKLINFGSGEKLKRGFFKEPAGLLQYMPLQMFFRHKYSGKAVTVWSLGRLLFRMLCGRLPRGYELQRIYSKTWTREDLSEQACLLIHSCMEIEEYKRLSLDKILKHSWFQENT